LAPGPFMGASSFHTECIFVSEPPLWQPPQAVGGMPHCTFPAWTRPSLSGPTSEAGPRASRHTTAAQLASCSESVRPLREAGEIPLTPGSQTDNIMCRSGCVAVSSALPGWAGCSTIFLCQNRPGCWYADCSAIWAVPGSCPELWWPETAGHDE
jgi:hypothetical protein